MINLAPFLPLIWEKYNCMLRVCDPLRPRSPSNLDASGPLSVLKLALMLTLQLFYFNFGQKDKVIMFWSLSKPFHSPSGCIVLRVQYAEITLVPLLFPGPSVLGSHSIISSFRSDQIGQYPLQTTIEVLPRRLKLPRHRIESPRTGDSKPADALEENTKTPDAVRVLFDFLWAS